MALKVGTSRDKKNIVEAARKVTKGLPITGKGHLGNWVLSPFQP